MLWQTQILLLARTQRSDINKIEKNCTHKCQNVSKTEEKDQQKNGYTWKSFTNISFPSNEEKQTERGWCVCVFSNTCTLLLIMLSMCMSGTRFCTAVTKMCSAFHLFSCAWSHPSLAVSSRVCVPVCAA